MAEDRPSRLVRHGAEIFGASVAAIVEWVAHGKYPPGMGAPVGAVVASAVEEFAGRGLSRRQEARVGAVICWAVERIQSRILARHSLRTDGFFAVDEHNFSSCDQLLEGVLLSVRDEFQERKLRHEAWFFANLVFTENVTSHTALLLLKSLERLTYRQLAILAIIGERDQVDFVRLRKPKHADSDVEALKREETELHITSDIGIFGLVDACGPWTDQLSVLGRTLYELAELSTVEMKERAAIDAVLALLPDPPQRT
jgi:hypothetical protein